MNYARESGFNMDLCTPEHPQANGQAEKFMSSIIKITHASLAEGKNPKEEMYKGKTPASLMMDRSIKTKLPSILALPTSITHLQAQQHDADTKAKQKKYADKHRRATDREYKIGDAVLLHQKKTTTKPPFNPDPYTVTQTKGTKITATRRGQEVTCNVDKWKIVKPRPHYLRTTTRGQTQTPEESDSDDDFYLPKVAPLTPTPPPQLQQGGPQDRQEPPQQLDRAPTPHRAPRERCEVAEGPWRMKEKSPSPRERKRRQQAAKKSKRGKEQRGIPYWLRNRGGGPHH